jgi:hypothetical protein
MKANPDHKESTPEGGMGFPTRASWVADLAGCAGLPTVQVGDRLEEW